MATVIANGLKVNYELTGEPGGTPVIFIHGGFGGAESTLSPRKSVFRAILPPERHQTITYDRRCAGGSEYVTRPYEIDDLAADARELLDALGFERAVVVGDSLGGMVALRYAMLYPETVEALVLMETAAKIMNLSQRRLALLQMAKYAPKKLVFRLLEGQVRYPPKYASIGPSPTPDEAEMRRAARVEFLAKLQSVSDEELFDLSVGLLQTYTMFANLDLADKLGELRLDAPIAVLHGTEDDIVSFRRGRVLHDAIPGSVMHELPGLGHGLPHYPEVRKMLPGLLDEMLGQSRSGASGSQKQGAASGSIV